MFSIQQLLRQMPGWRSCAHEGSHKVLSLIERCHTAAMGYHQYHCPDQQCNHTHYQYHGCRNRHCPHCGSGRAQQWMEERLGELLPVKYFHVVFTLPHELNALAYINRKVFFNLLFDASWHCIRTLSADPKRLGATPSMSSVLHTWGQNLCFHPHIHCIVSGGGADKYLRWKQLKKQGSGKYLFPYQVMEPLYKGYFLSELNKLMRKGTLRLPAALNWRALKQLLYSKKWIIHAKQPYGNAARVIEYLGRYTQKIAISNHRIKNIDPQNRVTFSWKDYNQGGKHKLMTLEGTEFLQRFEQHILPKGFVRIRHYGLLGNNRRKATIAQVLKNMDLPAHPPGVITPLSVRLISLYGRDPLLCPKCGKAKMELSGIHFGYSRAGPLECSNKFKQMEI